MPETRTVLIAVTVDTLAGDSALEEYARAAADGIGGNLILHHSPAVTYTSRVAVMPAEVAHFLGGGALSLAEARDDEEDTVARAAEAVLNALGYVDSEV